MFEVPLISLGWGVYSLFGRSGKWPLEQPIQKKTVKGSSTTPFNGFTNDHWALTRSWLLTSSVGVSSAFSITTTLQRLIWSLPSPHLKKHSPRQRRCCLRKLQSDEPSNQWFFRFNHWALSRKADFLSWRTGSQFSVN